MHKLKSNHIQLKPNQRLYSSAKPLIALTGGIATGKSSAAQYIEKMGIPLIDADKLIHQIYQKPVSIDFIQKHAPNAIHEGKIDFKILRKIFFTDSELKAKLEEFLYAQLPDQFQKALDEYKDSPFEYVVYDIPLLFEKDLQSKFDQVLLVYAPAITQVERLLQRDQISTAEAQKILDSQLDIEKKKSMADHIIENTQDFSYLERSVEKIIEFLTQTK